MVRIPCACHVKRNPSNDTRLPTFWQRPQNTAPATIFTKCPIPCTCHVNSRFDPPYKKRGESLFRRNISISWKIVKFCFDYSPFFFYLFFCARSVLGSLYEDPFGPLVSESCSRTCARSLLQAPFDYLYLSVQDFLWTTCIILEEHLRKISISGSFRPLLRGSCKTTCARSLYQGPLDHCVRTLYDHLCKISVSGSCWTTVSGSGWTTCARSVLGSLCEDPLDHLYLSVQDFLWTTCIILEEHLRKISISGSFRPLLRGSCKTTCARSLFQDPYPFGPLISIL